MYSIRWLFNFFFVNQKGEKARTMSEFPPPSVLSSSPRPQSPFTYIVDAASLDIALEIQVNGYENLAVEWELPTTTTVPATERRRSDYDEAAMGINQSQSLLNQVPATPSYGLLNHGPVDAAPEDVHPDDIVPLPTFSPERKKANRDACKTWLDERPQMFVNQVSPALQCALLNYGLVPAEPLLLEPGGEGTVALPFHRDVVGEGLRDIVAENPLLVEKSRNEDVALPQIHPQYNLEEHKYAMMTVWTRTSNYRCCEAGVHLHENSTDYIRCLLLSTSNTQPYDWKLASNCSNNHQIDDNSMHGFALSELYQIHRKNKDLVKRSGNNTRIARFYSLYISNLSKSLVREKCRNCNAD
jgi:hypothetical protein